MSKVVITGGAGFIGSHIAEEVAKEYEVVIIDNLDDYYSPDLKRRNLKLLLASKYCVLSRATSPILIFSGG
ncbi:MAG: GDP-mannose 4,6-dehydratase [Candidatus Methanoculleus thermohydrogenotrophicum]|nr:GDP-mannose 4,6-dehydratase [Candidatus Methanoculleus thermohydrogenotrophicum]